MHLNYWPFYFIFWDHLVARDLRYDGAEEGSCKQEQEDAKYPLSIRLCINIS
jgi:hypothetical protein